MLLMPLLSMISAGIVLAKDPVSTPIECARAIPTPIVNKSVFPNHQFVLKRDADRIPFGLETVRFRNGDKLVITHTGCESYAFDFQFETSRFVADVTDPKYWFDRSIQLMRQVEEGIMISAQIHRGIMGLEQYTKKNHHPSIGQAIDYGGKDIRSVVKLVEVRKMGLKKFIITVNFYYGPL
jgi:hypothetical protein